MPRCCSLYYDLPRSQPSKRGSRLSLRMPRVSCRESSVTLLALYPAGKGPLGFWLPAQNLNLTSPRLSESWERVKGNHTEFVTNIHKSCRGGVVKPSCHGDALGRFDPKLYFQRVLELLTQHAACRNTLIAKLEIILQIVDSIRLVGFLIERKLVTAEQHDQRDDDSQPHRTKQSSSGSFQDRPPKDFDV